MEKDEQNRKFELMLILDAQLPSEEKETVYKEAADIINKEGGKVINSKVWLEKQKFTFLIKKRSEGTYYLINFEGAGKIPQKIRPGLRLNEKILRFVTTKV